MDKRTWGEFVASSDDFGNGKQPAELVLNAHHRNKRRGLEQSAAQLLHVEIARNVFNMLNIPALAPHATNRPCNRSMFEGRRHNAPRFALARHTSPAHGEVIGLGRTGGKEDLVGVDAKAFGDRGTRLFEHLFRGIAHPMRRRWIAPCMAQHVIHRFNRLIDNGCGCSIIQISIASRLLHGDP